MFFFRGLILSAFLGVSLGLQAASKLKKSPTSFNLNLLTYEKFQNLKPRLKITYLKGLQQIFSEVETFDSMSLPGPSKGAGLRNQLQFLIEEMALSKAVAQNQNLPEPSGESRDKINDLIQKMDDLNNFLKEKEIRGDITKFEENKDDIFAKIRSINAFKTDNDDLFTNANVGLKKPMIDLEKRAKEINETLDTIYSIRQTKTNKPPLTYEQIDPQMKYKTMWKRTFDKISEAIGKLPDEKTLDKIESATYQCIYAGFVIPQKKNRTNSKCRPIQTTTLFKNPGDTNVSLTCKGDPNGPVLCNPLLFGFQIEKQYSEEACKDSFNLNTLDKAKFKPYCIQYGANASEQCGKISDGEGLCIARSYLNNNKKSWGELTAALNKVCPTHSNSNSNSNKDLSDTCNRIDDQIKKLNNTVTQTSSSSIPKEGSESTK